MAGQRRTSSRPPPPAEVRTASAQVVVDLLKRNHRLEVPTSYLVLVEGTTDGHYLRKAAGLVLAACGEDLLKLDPVPPDGTPQITICTPISPEDESGLRGGLPQIERLGIDLRTHILEYELPSPICFLLDHDEAGINAAKRLREQGFNIDRARPETLDPSCHPFACRTGRGEPEAVIEDLLSVRIQRNFLESAPAWCDVSYRDGKIVRCVWQKESKANLCGFVCDRADVTDVIELVRALVRIRQLWRLDVPAAVQQLLSQRPRCA